MTKVEEILTDLDASHRPVGSVIARFIEDEIRESHNARQVALELAHEFVNASLELFAELHKLKPGDI